MVAAAKSNLVVRADAGAQIGTGHLMRSLALAQSWQAAGGAITFVTNCESENLRGRLKKEEFRVVEIEQSHPHPLDIEITQDVLKDFPGAWCVVDGYHFDAEFHREIRRSGNRVLTIDDTAHLPFYDADAILNQNINASDLHYECPDDTILLSGTRFALLRREFLTQRTFERRFPVVAEKILITMGGGDFHNQTLKAIRAVERINIEDLKIKAIIGASNPHLKELKRHLETSPLVVELIENAENMPELMMWADAAISAAGSTCWEMAFMKLPCVLVVTAENQSGLAAHLEKDGFARNSGWFEKVSEDELAGAVSEILTNAPRRARMAGKGREIVDGRGAARVVETLRSDF